MSRVCWAAGLPFGVPCRVRLAAHPFCIGPIFGNLLPGPGPPRSTHRGDACDALSTYGFVATVPPRRLPNGLQLRYPDWTAVDFA